MVLGEAVPNTSVTSEINPGVCCGIPARSAASKTLSVPTINPNSTKGVLILLSVAAKSETSPKSVLP